MTFLGGRRTSIGPSDYLFDDFIPNQCTSYFTEPLTALAPVPSTESGAPYGGYLWSSIEHSLGSDQAIHAYYYVKSTITAGLASAAPFTVAWGPNDWTLFPTDYALPLAQRLGTSLDISSPASASITATPTGSQNSTPTTPKLQGHSSALGPEAKAGIAVGTILGVAFILVAIFLFLKRRRKRDKTTMEGQTPEMDDQDQELRTRKWFLGGRWRSEAEVVRQQHELDSRAVHVVPGPPAELDAGICLGGD